LTRANVIRPDRAQRRGASRFWAVARGAACLLLGLCGTAQAQVEGVLMPGPVIEGHAKYEGECSNCHVRFDRAGQDRRCRDCHKPVDADMAAHQGYHGKMPAQTCRACHTDHKGREARIVKLDAATFDHHLTDFELKGAHAQPKVKCESCHLARVKHRDAPGTCVACHRKDDTHKGSLGDKCDQCHTEVNWKEAKFDHATTKFPLLHKHAPVKCADCHKSGYSHTPMACVECHRKNDTHKTRYGDRCDTCHDDAGWKPARFAHDRQTRYPLLGKHQAAKCDSCHAGVLYRDKLKTDCQACHQKDDKHNGTLGPRCADCHTERAWNATKVDHDKTRFPLHGKHATTDCKLCHKSQVFNEAPRECYACHQKDDKHKGSLGRDCQQCHGEADWKKSSFDHAKTRFPLLGKHAKAECGTCHKDQDYKKTPQDCYACHQKDDKHDGQEGRDCKACHGEDDWKKVARFDHGLARFPLLGKHVQTKCEGCHKTPRFKDARSECNACHAKDDKHQRTLGTACEQCHDARTWKAWDFDHDRRTRFVLDGGHKGLACAACHTRPAGTKVEASRACLACHRKDDVHDGGFGRQCEQCHVSSSWKNLRARIGRPLSRAGPGGADVVGHAGGMVGNSDS